MHDRVRDRVKEVRGKGLMLGVELHAPCPQLVGKALDQGLLINVTADAVIRLLPPLTMTDAESDAVVDKVIGLIAAVA